MAKLPESVDAEAVRGLIFSGADPGLVHKAFKKLVSQKVDLGSVEQLGAGDEIPEGFFDPKMRSILEDSIEETSDYDAGNRLSIPNPQELQERIAEVLGGVMSGELAHETLRGDLARSLASQMVLDHVRRKNPLLKKTREPGKKGFLKFLGKKVFGPWRKRAVDKNSIRESLDTHSRSSVSTVERYVRDLTQSRPFVTKKSTESKEAEEVYRVLHQRTLPRSLGVETASVRDLEFVPSAHVGTDFSNMSVEDIMSKLEQRFESEEFGEGGAPFESRDLRRLIATGLKNGALGKAPDYARFYTKTLERLGGVIPDEGLRKDFAERVLKDHVATALLKTGSFGLRRLKFKRMIRAFGETHRKRGIEHVSANAEAFNLPKPKEAPVGERRVL